MKYMDENHQNRTETTNFTQLDGLVMMLAGHNIMTRVRLLSLPSQFSASAAPWRDPNLLQFPLDPVDLS